MDDAIEHDARSHTGLSSVPLMARLGVVLAVALLPKCLQRVFGSSRHRSKLRARRRYLNGVREQRDARLRRLFHAQPLSEGSLSRAHLADLNDAIFVEIFGSRRLREERENVDELYDEAFDDLRLRRARSVSLDEFEAYERRVLDELDDDVVAQIDALDRVLNGADASDDEAPFNGGDGGGGGDDDHDGRRARGIEGHPLFEQYGSQISQLGAKAGGASS
jgi:hypothetical protein